MLTLFRLLQDYIAAMRATAAATVALAEAQNRAVTQAAWDRYLQNRPPLPSAQDLGHAGGNASIPGGAA